METALRDRYAQTARAFDGVAAVYEGALGNGAVVQWMRRHLWSAVEQALPPDARLLDLGCGPGLDAAHFASRGHSVMAIDSSAEMVRRTKARAQQLGLSPRITALQVGIHELGRLAGERFDGIYSDLGALNCVEDLPAAADACADLIPAGAPLIASVMGRVCPWEILAYLARAHPRRAFVRFARKAVPVGLNGQTVWTRYQTPHQFIAAFSAGFVASGWRSLGLFVPPPYLVASSERLPWAVRPLAWLDERLAAAPLLRGVGDHFLVTLKRRG